MKPAANKTTSKPTNFKSTGFAPRWPATLMLLLLLPIVSLQTSCAHGSSVDKASLPVSSVLYQPPVLRIHQGQEIQTRDGLYRPQADEVWHSDARYRQLEQENINLAAALAALRK